MKREKRRWIYSGISIPAGVALVSPQRRPVAQTTRRVMLAGGHVAQALAPAMGRLATDSKVGLRVYLQRLPDQPVDVSWLVSKVKQYQPTVVLMAMQPPPNAQTIERRLRDAGSATFWLPTKGKTTNGLSAEALHLPVGRDTMTPTAAGCAAWAATVWRMIV